VVIYNALHQFLCGDLIWQMPTLAAGLIAVIPVVFLKRRWTRAAVFVVLFIALSVGLHMLFDGPIHAFQAWWVRPLGPAMVLK
jgi:hypothetical protein